MPTKGISHALNESVRIGQRLFPSASHHCFIHSGDKLEPNMVSHTLLESSLPQSDADLIFWLHALESKSEIDICRPDFTRIRKSMAVGHVGTFIANRLHNKLGGYSCKYFYAMDYDFMLKASLISCCKFLQLEGILICMDGGGASAQHPYKSLVEVWKIRCSILGTSRIKKVGLFIDFLYATLRRFLYDLLACAPTLRRLMRSIFNTRLLHSSFK